MEIWNLVFMQDEVDDGCRRPARAPGKNIDTGSSLERVAIVLQDVDNVFETDLLRPLLEVAESLSGRRYGRRRARRRLAQGDRRARPRDDVPDGRRRAAVQRGPRLRAAPDAPPRRHARAAARDREDGHAGAGRARRSSGSGDAYPGAASRTARSSSRSRARRRSGSRHAPAGDDAVRDRDREGGRREAAARATSSFKLHDTFGFPKQLTSELAAEAGFEVDDERFEALMEEQRGRGKRGAERARRGGARRRRRRGRHDRVRRLPDPRVRRPAARADRAPADGSRSRPRARRSASSWTGRRSTRSPAARSATRAWSGRPAGRSP